MGLRGSVWRGREETKTQIRETTRMLDRFLGAEAVVRYISEVFSVFMCRQVPCAKPSLPLKTLPTTSSLA